MPVTFRDADEYAACFTPLVLRDLRAALRGAFAQAARGGRGGLAGPVAGTVERGAPSRNGDAAKPWILSLTLSSGGSGGLRAKDLVAVTDRAGHGRPFVAEVVRARGGAARLAATAPFAIPPGTPVRLLPLARGAPVARALAALRALGARRHVWTAIAAAPVTSSAASATLASCTNAEAHAPSPRVGGLNDDQRAAVAAATAGLFADDAAGGAGTDDTGGETAVAQEDIFGEDVNAVDGEDAATEQDGDDDGADGGDDADEESAMESAAESPLAGRVAPLALVHGPPGTGKTATIAAVLAEFFARPLRPGLARRVLVCAPSNAALDELARRVRTTGLPTQAPLSSSTATASGEQQQPAAPGPTWTPRIVRVGLRDKVDPWVLAQASAPAGPIFLDDVVAARRGDATWSYRRTAYAERGALMGAEIVFCTLGSVHRIWPGIDFPLVVVDEAAQATEPDVVAALVGARLCRAVLVGDPQQLQPTVVCPTAARLGLARSAMARLMAAGHPAVLLRTQYRMPAALAAFASAAFYGGLLRTAAQPSALLLPALPGASALPPLTFVDVADGVADTRGTSVGNDAEVAAVAALVRRLARRPGVRSVGVITFYAEQQRRLAGAVAGSGGGGGAVVRVSTVDGFQGQEQDVIVVSCVRTRGSGGGIGFLANPNRVNVALTRARAACVVVGDGAFLAESDPTFAALVAHCRGTNAFLTGASSFVQRLDEA